MVPEINLLPKIEHGTSSKRLLFIVSGIIFAVLFLFLTVQYWTLSKSVNSLQSEEQLLTSEKVELETTVESLNVPERIRPCCIRKIC